MNGPVLTTVRLHLVNPLRSVLAPWVILGVALAANLLLFATITAGQHEVVATGGVFALHTALFAWGVSAAVRTLPYAVSLGVTRRGYLLGTGLLAVGQAVVGGAGLAVLRAVERGTGHWGIGLRLADLGFLASGGPVTAAVAYSGPLLLACAGGFAVGTAQRAWGTPGLLLLATLLPAAAAALAWWTVGLHGGQDLLHRVAGRPPLELQALWPTVLALALVALAWPGVRRAEA